MITRERERERERERHRISTQNLKTLSKWVTSFINSAFFSFIVDARVIHSHLKPNDLSKILFLNLWVFFL
jgi:hypothetical protein